MANRLRYHRRRYLLVLVALLHAVRPDGGADARIRRRRRRTSIAQEVRRRSHSNTFAVLMDRDSPKEPLLDGLNSRGRSLQKDDDPKKDAKEEDDKEEKGGGKDAKEDDKKDNEQGGKDDNKKDDEKDDPKDKENDKKGGKGDEMETANPTSAPTKSPIVSTPAPSPAPSTTPPTASPSSSPFAGPEDLFLSVSILIEGSVVPSDSLVDQVVLSAISHTFCYNTSRIWIDGYEGCLEPSGNRVLLPSDQAVLASGTVVDRNPSANDDAWTELAVSYDVVSIGEAYQQQVLDDRPSLTGAELQDASFEALRLDAVQSLDTEILYGSFDTLLQDGLAGTPAYGSPVGQETEVYETKVQQEDTTSTKNAYNPNNMLSMRIVGSALFVVTLVVHVALVYLARSRRKRIDLETDPTKEPKSEELPLAESPYPAVDSIPTGVTKSASSDSLVGTNEGAELEHINDNDATTRQQATVEPLFGIGRYVFT